MTEATAAAAVPGETDDMDSITSSHDPLHHHHYYHDAHDDFVRPILVGYAFGPKKMSTMTVVMAEASKSMMTEGEAEENEDDDEEDDEEEEEEDEEEAFDQAADDLQEGEDDTQHFDGVSTDHRATKEHHQLHDNTVIVSISGGSVGSSTCSFGDFGFKKAVGYFRSSCSSVAASETAGSTTTYVDDATMTTTTTPSSFGWKRSIRVSFVPLDLDIPLEEQHGGNMDIILHKLTEDILWVSQCSKRLPPEHDNDDNNTPRSSEQEERIQRLLQYQRDHPHCSLVDDPTRVQVVMNRADIAMLLQNHLVGVASTSGWAVRSPRYLVLNHEDLVGRPCESNDWTRRLTEARIRYPIIVKPLTAAGTKTSHSMAILLQPSALDQFFNKVQGSSDGSGGYLWQEYVNHNAVLFKVYVLGPHVRVYPRPSLPNLPYGDDLLQSHPKQTMVEFDSQRPYPQLSDFFEADSATATTANMNATVPLHVTVEEVQPIVQALKRAFGLELFGFDILVTTNTTTTSTTCNMDQQQSSPPPPELWVVDVNYFPSYKEVSNFSSLLAQYLTQRAIQGRRRRSQEQQPGVDSTS